MLFLTIYFCFADASDLLLCLQVLNQCENDWCARNFIHGLYLGHNEKMLSFSRSIVFVLSAKNIFKKSLKCPC